MKSNRIYFFGVIAAVLLIRFKVNSAWLVIGGGLVALLYRWIGG